MNKVPGLLLILSKLVGVATWTGTTEPSNPTTVPDYVGGCPSKIRSGQGFNVSFYGLPLQNLDGFDNSGNGGGMSPDFVYSGYKSHGGLIHTVNGITNTTFWYIPYTDRPLVWRTQPVYGYDVTNSNFTAVYEGYFYATQTGAYTFNMTADDQLSLQFGRGQSCGCGDFETDIVTEKIVSTTHGISFNDRSQIVTFRQNTYTVRLEAGSYYPIRMVYFNTVGSNVLIFNVIYPDGTSTDDFKDVYQVNPETACPIITTVPWTGSYVTDTTVTPTTSGGETTIKIKTPASTATTSSITKPWTGSYTSTTTIDSNTVVSGSTIPEVIISVNTPASTTTETVTQPWTGTYTSATTYTTNTVVNGSTVPDVIISVNTPTTVTTETVTQPWTGTSTSATTYTTNTVVNGSTVPDVIISVNTPTTVTTEAVTQPWTGTSTSATTYTTNTVVNGSTVPDVVISVNTPTTTTTKTTMTETVTHPWTGKLTTVTTYTTNTVVNGSTVPEIVISVDTPTSTDLITTATGPWTGTFTTTSTYTTETVIGGSTVPETVETLSRAVSSTPLYPNGTVLVKTTRPASTTKTVTVITIPTIFTSTGSNIQSGITETITFVTTQPCTTTNPVSSMPTTPSISSGGSDTESLSTSIIISTNSVKLYFTTAFSKPDASTEHTTFKSVSKPTASSSLSGDLSDATGRTKGYSSPIKSLSKSRNSAFEASTVTFEASGTTSSDSSDDSSLTATSVEQSTLLVSTSAIPPSFAVTSSTVSPPLANKSSKITISLFAVLTGLLVLISLQ